MSDICRHSFPPPDADPVPPAAETQGLTERYIGSWLKGSGRRREDVVLASKVSGYGRQPYLREGGKVPRVDAANIEYAVNKSLERLGTDHLDLLQIHWPDRCVCCRVRRVRRGEGTRPVAAVAWPSAPTCVHACLAAGWMPLRCFTPPRRHRVDKR